MELWKGMDTLNGGEEGLQTSGHSGSHLLSAHLLSAHLLSDPVA
jgi:hypothetical protein